MNLVCPMCGSDKITIVEIEKMGKLTLGFPFSYKLKQHKCSNCGDVGNFDGLLEDGYEQARTEAEKAQAIQLIDYLESKGCSLQYLERAFELPFRTLSRWKKGNCSSSGLALLRIATALPFVTEISEQKYTRECIIKECGNYFVSLVSSPPTAPIWSFQNVPAGISTSPTVAVTGAFHFIVQQSFRNQNIQWPNAFSSVETTNAEGSATVIPMLTKAGT